MNTSKPLPKKIAIAGAPLTPEQKQMTKQRIDQNAKIARYCLEMASAHCGELIQSEDLLVDIALEIFRASI